MLSGESTTTTTIKSASADVAREAERTVKRVLAQYESDQRGISSY